LDDNKIWLLRLVLPGPYGRWLTGLLLLALLLPLFHLGVGDSLDGTTPALFFSLIIAYIVPIFSFITAKSQEALRDLRPYLDLDPEAFTDTHKRLASASGRAIAVQVVGGVLGGVTHMSLVRGSPAAALEAILASMQGALSTLGAVLVWLVMTTVISMLIQQASIFARLGRDNVRLSLLNTRSQSPFARVSISSSLAMVGALALFPLISFESGLDLMESLPGTIATLIPMIAMFIIPVWPVHRRLAAMKSQQLAGLGDRVDTFTGDDGSVDLEDGVPHGLVPLLYYRSEIANASTWPFDWGNLSRLVFYLVIPPLTWVAAALIENVVDAIV
jgi:hypothetical protein